jgi:hypothetical protein
MWYISFHGGKGGNNNIHLYHDDGTPHKHHKVLPTGSSDPELSELRGFIVSDGKQVLVANAYKKFSQILHHVVEDTEHCTFKQVYASPAINSIDHPYDVAIDSSTNRLFVSNQDTNTVTCLTAARTAAPIASYLQEKYGTNFLQGTFVASSNGKLPNTPVVTSVPEPQGLGVEIITKPELKVQHSVRGITYHNGFLYVADQPANAVKAYNGNTGALVTVISGSNLKDPTQVLVQDNVLYIGSAGNGNVVTCALPDGQPPAAHAPLNVFISGKATHISGMSFDNAGHFYAADRIKKCINQFSSTGTFIKTVVKDLSDNPEFIVWVAKSS